MRSRCVLIGKEFVNTRFPDSLCPPCYVQDIGYSVKMKKIIQDAYYVPEIDLTTGIVGYINTVNRIYNTVNRI